jgi:hypothetical protein
MMNRRAFRVRAARHADCYLNHMVKMFVCE